MDWDICVDTDGDNVKDLCFPLYVSVRDRLGPDPDPRVLDLSVLLSDPDPLVVGALEEVGSWAKDVVRLAAVADIASTIADRDLAERLSALAFESAAQMVVTGMRGELVARTRG